MEQSKLSKLLSSSRSILPLNVPSFSIQAPKRPKVDIPELLLQEEPDEYESQKEIQFKTPKITTRKPKVRSFKIKRGPRKAKFVVKRKYKKIKPKKRTNNLVDFDWSAVFYVKYQDGKRWYTTGSGTITANEDTPMEALLDLIKDQIRSSPIYFHGYEVGIKLEDVVIHKRNTLQQYSGESDYTPQDITQRPLKLNHGIRFSYVDVTGKYKFDPDKYGIDHCMFSYIATFYNRKTGDFYNIDEISEILNIPQEDRHKGVTAGQFIAFANREGLSYHIVDMNGDSIIHTSINKNDRRQIRLKNGQKIINRIAMFMIYGDHVIPVENEKLRDKLTAQGSIWKHDKSTEVKQSQKSNIIIMPIFEDEESISKEYKQYQYIEQLRQHIQLNQQGKTTLVIKQANLYKLHLHIFNITKIIFGREDSIAPKTTSNGIVEFHYYEIRIIAFANYDDSLELHLALGKPPEQLPKTFSSQAGEIFSQMGLDLSSFMNDENKQIFSEVIRAKNEIYYDQEEGDIGIDNKKSYSSAFLLTGVANIPKIDIGDQYIEVDHEVAMHNYILSENGQDVTDSDKPYDCAILFDVVSTNTELLNGSFYGYQREILRMAYREGIDFRVVNMLVPRVTIRRSHVKHTFLTKIESLKLSYRLEKFLVNTIIGLFAMTKKEHHAEYISPILNDLKHIAHKKYNGKNIKFSKYTTINTIGVDINDMDLSIDGEVPELIPYAQETIVHKMVHSKRHTFSQNMVPVYNMILQDQYMVMYKLRRMILKIPSIQIISICTDEITFRLIQDNFQYAFKDNALGRPFLTTTQGPVLIEDNKKILNAPQELLDLVCPHKGDCPVRSANQCRFRVTFKTKDDLHKVPLDTPYRRQQLDKKRIHDKLPTNLIKDRKWIHIAQDIGNRDDLYDKIRKHILEDNRPLFIEGLAGTGKSWFIRNIMSDATAMGKKWKILAPTQVAAQNISGRTIHKGFNLLLNDDATRSKKLLKMIRSYDGILVDEAMMANNLLYEICCMVKAETNVNLVFVGDSSQLSPIFNVTPIMHHATKIVSDYKYINRSVLCHLMDGYKVTLRQCMRANDHTFLVCKSTLYYDDIEATSKPIRDIVRRTVSTGDDIIERKNKIKRALCYTNVVRDSCNIHMARQFQEGKKTMDVSLYSMFAMGNKKTVSIYEALPIMFLKTVLVNKKYITSQLNLINNGVYHIKSFSVTKITLNVPEDQNTIVISPSDMIHFDVAYCVTVHKSQSQTYDDDYIIYEWNKFSKEMKYTALSRTTDINKVWIDANGIDFTIPEKWDEDEIKKYDPTSGVINYHSEISRYVEYKQKEPTLEDIFGKREESILKKFDLDMDPKIKSMLIRYSVR